MLFINIYKYFQGENFDKTTKKSPFVIFLTDE